MSYAFPSVLVYRFGSVCLCWTFDVSQTYWMVWILLWYLRWLSFSLVNPKRGDNIAVDAFRNCYVSVLCTICDVWLGVCWECCGSSPLTCKTKTKVRCCYGICDACLSHVYCEFCCSSFLLVRLRLRWNSATKFAMAVLLMCKNKGWWQYFGGCTSNIVCIRFVYHMWCVV